jgi:large subunit ribosomal protein L3
MPHGIIGKKQGMSRIFQEDGTVIPVTLIKCDENIVCQVKTVEKGGVESVVLSSGERNKPTKTRKYYNSGEFAVVSGQKDLVVGDKVCVADFENVESVEIKGVSKGKGFQGVIKRHGFSRGPETHGSDHHRAPGSIGACAEPGRVVKGKKLPGRMGGDNITLKSVPVVRIFPEENIIALKGAVPGARNSAIYIYVEKVK